MAKFAGDVFAALMALILLALAFAFIVAWMFTVVWLWVRSPGGAVVWFFISGAFLTVVGSRLFESEDGS